MKYGYDFFGFNKFRVRLFYKFFILVLIFGESF